VEIRYYICSFIVQLVGTDNHCSSELVISADRSLWNTVTLVADVIISPEIISGENIDCQVESFQTDPRDSRRYFFKCFTYLICQH
jgi:hypothetical protein